jgi:tetratricopeptide (TPR) repeat protein
MLTEIHEESIRMRPKRVGIALGLALLLGLAYAPDVRAEQASCTVHENQDRRRTEARQRFMRGQELFDSANFRAAMAEFECSFQNVPHPSTLYNVARAAELSGEFQRALDAWRGYLRMNPEADDRAEIEMRITGLETSLREVEAVNNPNTGQPVQPAWTPPANDTPSTHAAPQTWETPNDTPSNVYTPDQNYQTYNYAAGSSPWRSYGWYIASGGFALAVIGLIFATPLILLMQDGNGYTSADEYTCANQDMEDDGITPIWIDDSSYDYVEVSGGCRTFGWIMVGVGGAALLGGVLTATLAGRGGRNRASLVPQLAMGNDGSVSGGSAVFSYRF